MIAEKDALDQDVNQILAKFMGEAAWPGSPVEKGVDDLGFNSGRIFL
jgi:hypothetical protein